MNFSSLEEELRRKLLLMGHRGQRHLLVASIEIPPPPPSASKTFPVHDWGVFGEYEYLGAGTPYTAKHRAGIKPRNDLDQIAFYHDQQYSWSEKRLSGVQRNIFRGGMDYGAGSAMQVAAINPWSDLTVKQRALAFVAGTGLVLQGTLRVNPAFWLAGSLLDIIIY